MTTQRRVYRIVNPADLSDLAHQLNIILSQISDRLDAMEGYRGTPTFKSDIDLDGNDITNVGSITYA